MTTIKKRQVQNGDMPDTVFLDSLKKCDQTLQLAISNCISTTKKLVEYDQELAIKDKTVYSLHAISILYKKCIVKYTGICKKGVKAARQTSSPEDWDIHYFSDKVDSLATVQLEAINTFQQRYHITIEELKVHGLTE